MEKALVNTFGGNTEIFFCNGCCGDLDPVERGGFDAARRLGERLAESVAAVVGGRVNLMYDEAHFSIRTLKVTVPLVSSVKIEEWENKRAELLAKVNHEQHDIILNKVEKAYLHWVEKMLQKAREGSIETEIHADIKLIRLGKLVIVTLPFEAFHDIGLKIKQHFGCDNTMVICYANGIYGYLPSKEQYKLATYEAGEAHKFYGLPGPMSIEAEDIILRELIKGDNQEVSL